MSLPYRPEIDGLRAIAVLSVVLYHAGLGGAGYVGVDIFFVISGYLITALLLEEHRTNGGIDLGGFYSRRIRRILPALVLMVAVTMILSLVLLSPHEQDRVARSAIASAGFVANLYFQATTGSYFDGSSDQMPFLHLWSLAVEEQFYLAWPLALLAILRFNSTRAWLVTAGLLALSFGLAEYLVLTEPEAAFFQSPARMWELASGAIVAMSKPRSFPGWWLPSALLVTVASAVVPVQPFPAQGAAPAVIGTAALLLAIHGGATLAILRVRPVVFVGLVSYSFYLWHWPLLALYRATTIGGGELSVRLLVCLAAFVAAVCSYRFVETPFRRSRTNERRTLFTGVGTLFLTGSLGALLVAVPWRVDKYPEASRAEADRPPNVCHSQKTDGPVPRCLPRRTTRVAIWGDSMAYSWTPAAWKSDPNAVAFTRDACGPFVGYLPEKALAPDLACAEYNANVAGHLNGVDTLVLVALWADDSRMDSLDATLSAVENAVGGVVILGPSPTLRAEAPRCVRNEDVAACAIPRSEFEGHARPILERLRKIAASHPNVSVVDVSDTFCTASTCPVAKDGAIQYWDTHHVSMTAAARFVLPGYAAR